MEGHEEADRLAKQALKHAQIDIRVSMSKTEVKGLIANEIKKWQKEWDSGRKGRHLYHIQEKVGLERREHGNRKDDVLMSRMRIGHCLLNQCLHRMHAFGMILLKGKPGRKKILAQGRSEDPEC